MESTSRTLFHIVSEYTLLGDSSETTIFVVHGIGFSGYAPLLMTLEKVIQAGILKRNKYLQIDNF